MCRVNSLVSNNGVERRLRSSFCRSPPASPALWPTRWRGLRIRPAWRLSAPAIRSRPAGWRRPGRRTNSRGMSASAVRPTAHRSPSCGRCREACRGTGRPVDVAPDARRAAGAWRTPADRRRRRASALPGGGCPAPPIALDQPQHAAVDGSEQPHPAIERGRHDLVVVVEAAEHEPLLRQSAFLPGAARAAIRRSRSFT